MNTIHYLVKNPFLKTFLKWIDFFGYKWFQKTSDCPSKTFQKILICNIAHLGDALIFSSLLPLIQSMDKRVEIGVLVNSLSEPIFLDHPNVKWIHFLDHWKLNRSSIHKIKKILHYFLQKRKTAKNIRKVKYDLAIDFYPFFPNANHVLWKGKIPTRVGYNSGGFGFFLTKSLSWADTNQFILNSHIQLLKTIFPNCVISTAKPVLLIKNRTTFKLQNYIIFHIGTGNPVKEWAEKKWKGLIQNLKSHNNLLVFTGKGNREKQLVANIIDGNTNCNNLVDQLSLKDLIELVSGAKLIVCCDSLPVHLAWAFERPAVVLQMGTTDPDLWTPPNPKASYLRPCLSNKEIPLESVLAEVQKKIR